MAQDGRHFFYVNPLEVWPTTCRHNPGKFHVKPVRPGWFACASPPNVARLLSSLVNTYTMNDDTLYTHLYIGGEAEVRLGNVPVKVTQTSARHGMGMLRLRFSLSRRRVDRSSSHSGLVARQSRYAGERARGDRGGYYPRRLCYVKSVGTGDTVELAFSMEIHQVRANPNIRGMPARPRFSAGRWYTAWRASIMERRYPRCRSQAIRSFIPDSMRIFLAEPLS